MLYLTKNTDDQNINIYICGDGAELIPLEMLTLSLKLRDYFLSSVSQKVVSEQVYKKSQCHLNTSEDDRLQGAT